MSETMPIELLAILAVGIPTAILGLIQLMVSRYGSGNKALDMAIETQRLVNTNYQQAIEDKNKLSSEIGEIKTAHAEQTGSFKSQIKILETDLQAERDNNKKLTQDMVLIRDSHDTSIKALKADSDRKILALSNELNEMRKEIKDIRELLTKTQAERDAIKIEKDKVTQERDGLDKRVREMLSKQDEIQAEMELMRSSYEKTINELSALIIEKEKTIDELKKQLEENDDESTESVESVDAGGDGIDDANASDGARGNA